MLFLSTYINKLDSKGRVSVPSSFRSVLASENFSGIIVYPSFVNECLEACGMQHLQSLYKKIENLDPFSPEREYFETAILSGSVQLAMDKEGRVMIPEELQKEAGLSEKIVFAGKGATFEIWNEGKFEAYKKKAKSLARDARGALKSGLGSSNNE